MLSFVPLFVLLSTVPVSTVPARPDPTPARPAWASVVDCDAVRVELDTVAIAAPSGAGALATSALAPVRARLRWSLRDAEVSPSAWALGVRTTVDEVEVDCASASSRTLASRAFRADGAALAAASFATASPAWRRHGAESMGALIAGAVCRAAGRAATAVDPA